MRPFAEQNNLKLGAVAQPLRAALTGRTTSPGIFDVLAVLGREECLARLADQAGRRGALKAPGLAVLQDRAPPSCSAQGNKIPRKGPRHPARLAISLRMLPFRPARFSQRFHRGLHDGRKIQHQTATLTVGNKTYDFPILSGTSGPTSSTSPSSTPRPGCSPTTPASPRPAAASPRSPISTATPAS
jgi:hypothetical protein